MSKTPAYVAKLETKLNDEQAARLRLEEELKKLRTAMEFLCKQVKPH